MPQAYRDRDIRNAMRDLLAATGQFDVSTCDGLPETRGWPGGALRGVNIDAWNSSDADLCDDAGGPTLLRSATLKVTFAAIDDDPAVCTDMVERLINVAANACNGQCLAGLTFPGKTKFTNLRWLKPSPPERRCEATFTYQYEIITFTDFNTSE